MLYFIDIKEVMRMKKVIMIFKIKRKKTWGIIPYLCSRTSFEKNRPAVKFPGRGKGGNM